MADAELATRSRLAAKTCGSVPPGFAAQVAFPFRAFVHPPGPETRSAFGEPPC